MAIVQDTKTKLQALNTNLQTLLSKWFVKIDQSSYQGKNVIVDSNGKIGFEDKYQHPSTHPASMITGLSEYSLSEATASSNAFKSYILTKDGTQVGSKIDIPKDYLVKSGSVKTAGSTLTSAESAAGVTAKGKYISLIINTKDSSSSSGNTELIIPANDLVDSYTGDGSSIVVSNNQISVSSSILNMVDGYSGTIKDATLDELNQLLTNAITQAGN